MAPRPHDPNLSEDIQPLIKVDNEVLTGRMDEIVTTVSELEERTVLIYVRLNATAMQVLHSKTDWLAWPLCLHDKPDASLAVIRRDWLEAEMKSRIWPRSRADALMAAANMSSRFLRFSGLLPWPWGSSQSPRARLRLPLTVRRPRG